MDERGGVLVHQILLVEFAQHGETDRFVAHNADLIYSRGKLPHLFPHIS
jgi:hypothetical protein